VRVSKGDDSLTAVDERLLMTNAHLRVTVEIKTGSAHRDRAAATEVTMGGPYGILTMIGAIVFILVMLTVTGQY
jgi:hypothetical protein